MDVWSNYQHKSKTHRSSVTTIAQYIDSGWKSPGVQARAAAQASINGNKANYDYK